ncbi:MAG: ABC transporter permease [Caulobacteraceae bacterium]|nr:ABC transporter permease [Caulobacteraceae bacterium]
MRAAGFRIDQGPNGPVLALSGDWTAGGMGDAGKRLLASMRGQPFRNWDIRDLGKMDTAGAFILLMAGGGTIPAEVFAARPETARIVALVDSVDERAERKVVRVDPIVRTLEKTGRGVANFGSELYRTLAFNGHLLATAGRAVVQPKRIRWAAWFSQIDRAGLDALPIVAITTFFIGAVVAFLAADMLQQFGAAVFAVELIGISVLREFGVVLTAVLLAGRSASSFAAEIGAMKMNQEVDAMKVMGVDPFDALVLPRLAALVIMLPALTLVADLSGLFGGAIVAWTKLDLSPAFFLQRIQENVGAMQFWVGMSKAPVFALVIAAIGARQGMAVGGDVESLGERVTSAVVQAIFAIIVIDAIFAMIYLELNI